MRSSFLLPTFILGWMSTANAGSPAPISWSAFYVGGHIGGAWLANRAESPGSDIAIFELGVGPTQKGDGVAFASGVQAGLNHQIGQAVFGVELEWAWDDVSGSSIYPI